MQVKYSRTPRMKVNVLDNLGEPLLSFVRRLSSLTGSKVLEKYGGNTLGPQAVSFVERLSLFQSVHYQRFLFIGFVKLSTGLV